MLTEDATETIRRRYNRTAFFFDWMDAMISPELRRRAVSMAFGDVLEVGVGTGGNLSFYAPECRVTGIDFSPKMLEKARQKLPGLRAVVNLLEMDAQRMSFPDETFDSVLATCVFCSVPDPVQGLREIRRVCRRDGKIILLEHVRSENPVLGRLMDWFNPVPLHLVGSNINRRTVDNVRAAGITIDSIEHHTGGIVKLIFARP